MTQDTLSPSEKQPSTALPTASDTSSAQSSEQFIDQLINDQLNVSDSQDGLSSAAEVEISTEKFPARERRIQASVFIPQPVDKVWSILTDYEHLSDFIPSLSSSKLLQNSEGLIRLEQIGTQCFLKVKFCARVVLDMTENFPHEIGFSMQEGDFKMFKGAWQLTPSEDQQGTFLSYNLDVKPPLAMPVKLIEHHLKHNLTANLQAIHHRALQLAT